VKRLAIVIICSICWINAFAQKSIDISGKIMSNGQPVAFATVGITGTTCASVADEQGFFRLVNVPSGKQELIVTAVGFQTYKQRIAAERTMTELRIELIPLTTDLNEVVITGTMKEVSRKESPVPIEVISPRLFQQSASPTLFEGLGMVNGIRPQLNCNVCNTGDIHINGMEGPYTMVLIDGMPIVSALSTVYGLMGIPNSMVERIEVQRGPASTLYGSEAVGGLINIITKQPQRAPLASFDAFATSYGEYNVDGSVKLKPFKKTNALFSINYFNLPHRWDKNRDNFTDVTLQHRISAFSKWNVERKNNRTLSIAARYFYEDRFGGELNWKRAFRGGDSIYGESIYTARWELLGAYDLPFKKEKVTLNYSFNQHHQNSVYGNVFYLATQRIGFAQLVWDKRISKRHQWLLGTAIRNTYYDDNTPVTAVLENGQPANRPSKVWLPGFFIQDEIRLHSHHTLLLGARTDVHPDHGYIFSPRFNYKWSPTTNTVIRLSAGNGFRVVNLFSEEHAVLTGAREVVIKSELKPERSWNVNLNMNRYISFKKGFLSLDASVFYTVFTNRIVPDYFSNANQVVFDNLSGRGINRGVNFSADVRLTSSLTFMLGCTFVDVYLREKDSTNQSIKTRQVQTPPFTANYALTYNFQKAGITIDWNGVLYSPMLLPVLPNDYRADHSPWFTLMNVQATKKLNSKTSVYTAVKNLLNFVPSNPIMRPHDPFDKQAGDITTNPNGYTFDPTYNYAPLQGIRVLMGVRWLLNE
jgi:outer membrane receptor for ferrienterochelin and colicins